MEEMNEIDLLDLFYIIKGRFKFIIATMLIAMLLSGLASVFLLTPEYQTFTTLMLGKPADYDNQEGINYQEILTNQKLIGTYGEIAKSMIVLDKVNSNLDLGYSSAALKQQINISLLNNTEIIKVSVKDVDPVMAAKIANELGTVFTREVSRIMKINNIQVIDAATVPKNTIGPKVKLNVAIAGVLGLMVSVFIVFLIEMLDRTLKVSADVEKALGLPVLGIIPEIVE